jgi:hypothetical protein
MHDLGGMGFTWFGGLIGGVVAALVIVRRHQLPLGVVAGVVLIAHARHLNRPRRAAAQTPRDKAMTVRRSADLRES